MLGFDVEVYSIDADAGQSIFRFERDLHRIVCLLEEGALLGGGVYRNHLRLGLELPRKPSFYYRKWRVKPSDEEIRQEEDIERIVVGRNGEIYYTANHYYSFVQIAG